MFYVSFILQIDTHLLIISDLSSQTANMSKKDIYYSDKYTDEKYEYRHVMLPKDLAKLVPKTHLMSEAEWRNLGVQQSLGELIRFSQ